MMGKRKQQKKEAGNRDANLVTREMVRRGSRVVGGLQQALESDGIDLFHAGEDGQFARHVSNADPKRAVRASLKFLIHLMAPFIRVMNLHPDDSRRDRLVDLVFCAMDTDLTPEEAADMGKLLRLISLGDWRGESDEFCNGFQAGAAVQRLLLRAAEPMAQEGHRVRKGRQAGAMNGAAATKAKYEATRQDRMRRVHALEQQGHSHNSASGIVAEQDKISMETVRKQVPSLKGR